MDVLLTGDSVWDEPAGTGDLLDPYYAQNQVCLGSRYVVWSVCPPFKHGAQEQK